MISGVDGRGVTAVDGWEESVSQAGSVSTINSVYSERPESIPTRYSLNDLLSCIF